ncbi:MAG: Na+/H+ antiporter NhaA [Candidatus Hydrogenedentes bacterium]|nr:Na+/H+ antiporter NhaA [Candidatus Hydrogenedentota bacterium]
MAKQSFVRNIPPLEYKSNLQQMLHHDAMAASVLLIAALAAFVVANSSVEVLSTPLGELYKELWHMELGISIQEMALGKPLHLWINDGLMAIFFFVVGLEIKREMLVGELASFRKAFLPIVAAFGGMVAPAGIYTLFNYGTDAAVGWGIPMATDIAFAAGVIGLMSKRIPSSLAVFLIALAIVDDLGSVLVIAIFYTATIETTPLLIGIAVVLASLLFSRLGVRSALVFMLMAIVVWIAFLSSGVHATIAGVLFAFTVPVDARYETPLFAKRMNILLKRFQGAEDFANPLLVNARQQDLLRAIELECIHVEAPLQRIESRLHPICAFIIMPIFAFANSGVKIDFGNLPSLILSPVTLGVVCGLVIGKQLGILSCCYVTVKLGLAELPTGIRWSQIWGVSCLAGIGFTMSLFVGELAFAGGGHDAGHGAPATTVAAGQDTAHDAHAAEPEAAVSGLGKEGSHLAEAKAGTLLASILAATAGCVALILVTRKGEGDMSGLGHESVSDA